MPDLPDDLDRDDLPTGGRVVRRRRPAVGCAVLVARGRARKPLSRRRRRAGHCPRRAR